MDCIAEILRKRPFAVLDGSSASELERLGYNLKDSLWSARALYERPDLVREVHRRYLAAGADIVESDGYQATVSGFMKKCFTRKKAEDLLRLSVRLVKEACAAYGGKGPFPPIGAAAVGPYGAQRADGSEYSGRYDASPAEVEAFHQEQLAIIAEEEPDLFACETIPLLSEAEALCRVLSGIEGASAWVSFSCRDGQYTCGGDDIGDCAAFLDQVPQIAAIGVNCIDPAYGESLICRIRERTEKPIVIYPNSGETYDLTEKCWHGTAADFRHLAKVWYERGARIIGGCCRTGPEEIGAVAAARQEIEENGWVPRA